jgi:2,4-dienoyl-CoA reductase-like NADH-dependent reductase (Old Yellow Enzyme family)
MSEILGSPEHAPGMELETLYGRWAEGGIGLSISGNVMVDRTALGEPGNVVLDSADRLEAFRRWAKAGRQNDTRFWMQLNHPGKQSPKFLTPQTVAPSAIGFGPRLAKAFSVPRALEEHEIEGIIQAFAQSASLAKQAGFDGVQIHGAHGYLVSQFLSPRHNQRTDRWGGSLENRSRFALEILKSIREQVGPEFPIGIKMNSSDFQKGGFDEEDSVSFMQELVRSGIDLIEVSGGTYEAPAMTGQNSKVRESTKLREGYFLSFVENIRDKVSAPLAVTGGFRSSAGIPAALDSGIDMVGLARPLAVDPDFPNSLLNGDHRIDLRRLSTGLKSFDQMISLDITWYENQIARIARGKQPDPGKGAWSSTLETVWRTGLQSFKMRRAK